ncbi:MAG: S8 family serine peptidase, partial [Blastocatellia bacterium]
GVRIEDECTLGSIACGQKTIVVGSLDADGYPEQPETLKVSKTSSSGKTRDEREKPDIVAPGELILAACSRTLVLREHISGTSISAAAVTGTVALMLAEARSIGIDLTADDILEILRDEESEGVAPVSKKSSRKVWHPRLGRGCVSVEEALKRVAARKQNPPSANPKSSKKR